VAQIGRSLRCLHAQQAARGRRQAVAAGGSGGSGGGGRAQRPRPAAGAPGGGGQGGLDLNAEPCDPQKLSNQLADVLKRLSKKKGGARGGPNAPGPPSPLPGGRPAHPRPTGGGEGGAPGGGVPGDPRRLQGLPPSASRGGSGAMLPPGGTPAAAAVTGTGRGRGLGAGMDWGSRFGARRRKSRGMGIGMLCPSSCGVQGQGGGWGRGWGKGGGLDRSPSWGDVGLSQGSPTGSEVRVSIPGLYSRRNAADGTLAGAPPALPRDAGVHVGDSGAPAGRRSARLLSERRCRRAPRGLCAGPRGQRQGPWVGLGRVHG